MAGVLNDLQLIYQCIVYLKDIHGTIQGNKSRCQGLSIRCQMLESRLRLWESKSNGDFAEIGPLKTVVEECVKFIEKYGKEGWKRSLMNVTFSKSIENEFQSLNAALTQAVGDLHFGISATSHILINEASATDDIALGKLFREIVESYGENACDIHNSEDVQRLFPALHKRVSELIDAVAPPTEADTNSDSDPSIKISLEDTTSVLDSESWNNRKLIGKGSFASVFSCMHSGRLCAVKYFEGIQLMNEKEVRSIKKEIRIMQLSKHPNIIEFIDANLEKGYIVCEMAQCTLYDVLHRDLRFDVPSVDCKSTQVKIEWLLGIANALHYLHLHDITHRDIKSQNILLVVDTAKPTKIVAKLSDFGVSTAVGMSTAGGTAHSVGTYEYMAPEAIGDDDDGPMYSFAVDIYSFGVLINELMSGVKPWAGKRNPQIISLVGKGVRPEVFLAVDEAGKRLLKLIGDVSGGCLAASPVTRPSSQVLVSELKLIQLLLGFEYVKQLADNGDAICQCQIGLCYLVGSGSGVTMDASILKAHEIVASAGVLVDVRLVCTSSFEANYSSALNYFCRAAEQGNAIAQYLVGRCYCYGHGVEINLEISFKYFKLSADQGDSRGQCYVGVCYEKGRGTSIDLVEAFKYYKLSADQGNAAAQCNVGVCSEYGRGTAIDLGEAFKYYKLSADRGNAAAQCTVGVCFEVGRGTTIDKTEALKYYKLSADQGNSVATSRMKRL